MQHYVLASLWRAKFFAQAAFHGGTCLRILFGMNRFSEDLDFVLKEAASAFDWRPYLERIEQDCRAEGLELEVQGREELGTAVRRAFLKTDSIGQILNLELPYARHASRKIRIKLEVDTNPPASASFETRYITFPVTAAITSMDLRSGFGSKSHALLCREYTKGRDWYDFLWYASRSIVPNFDLLTSALDQQGPWAGQQLHIDAEWYLEAMKERIESIDWPAARRDVERFVMSREQPSLELWRRELFLQHLERLAETLLGSG
jgi:predicted nucleotidyltransferase component of viral defense system